MSTVRACNVLLQADWSNHLVRRVNLTSGLVITLAGNVSGAIGSDNYGHADGTRFAASFYFPWGVAVDALGVIAVIVRQESECCHVSRLHSSVCDDKFSQADRNNHLVRTINLTDGHVFTLCGDAGGYADGSGTASSFLFPYGIALDGNGTFALVVRGVRRGLLILLLIVLMFVLCVSTGRLRQSSDSLCRLC